MEQSTKGQVEEVWIKTEPIEGEPESFFNIKCEEEIDINDSDPFASETVFYTVTEISPDTDKGPFKCEIIECGKEFNQKSRFNRHRMMHSGVKPFACDVCGLRFAQKAHIKPHQRIHTGEKPYSCNYCDMTFMYGKYLKRHIEITHSELNGGPAANPVQKIFECECGEKFTRNENFKWHKRIHAGDIPFKCDECGKPFFRKDHYDKHKRMHTGEKPFECDICGARFSQKAHVKPHKLTHSDKRPFSCDECDKKFSCLSKLKKHKIEHLARTLLFPCDVCGKIFAFPSELTKHKKVHKENIPLLSVQYHI